MLLKQLLALSVARHNTPAISLISPRLYREIRLSARERLVAAFSPLRKSMSLGLRESPLSRVANALAEIPNVTTTGTE